MKVDGEQEKGNPELCQIARLSAKSEYMLGLFQSLLYVLKRSREPKRPRPTRITILESQNPAYVFGPQVAQVMGWEHFDARNGVAFKETGPTVVSRDRSYISVPSRDGLTVRVDDVCDLRNNVDPHACLRAIMLKLRDR